MCRKRSHSTPCWHYECPQNLFWIRLRLDEGRIHVTRKALEIGNCCRLLRGPWTVEDIGAVWGIPAKEVKRIEERAWKKLFR